VRARPVAGSPLVRRWAGFAVLVLTGAGLLTFAGSAAAQPQPTISGVQAKLKKLTDQENWLIQRYDAVSQELASARQRLSLVDREVARDSAAMRSMRDQIAQIAATVYENGSMTSPLAVLTTSSPQSLLSESAILTHLSTVNHEQLVQFLATDRQLLGAQQMARRAEAAVAGLRNQLARQKASLKKVISQDESLLSTLTARQRQQQLGGGGTSTGTTYTGPTSTQAEKAVAFAYAQIGCPYVYGGTGPCQRGYDCSGLTQAAWAAAGVQIPRTSYEQATLPSVSLSDLQPGDILEFAGDSHVGLYVGGGYLIDSPQPGYNVEKVSLHSPWYAANLDGAVRP
jgi:cell wall-associated NlpC family hydrolase